MNAEKIDSSLSPLDWLAAIVCSPLGCIVGLYYLVKGSPKAGKMLLVSIIVSVVVNLIGIIAIGSGALTGR